MQVRYLAAYAAFAAGINAIDVGPVIDGNDEASKDWQKSGAEGDDDFTQSTCPDNRFKVFKFS